MIQLLAKPVASKIQQTVSHRVEEFTRKYRRKPKLAVVIVGEDPASLIYTRKKGETALALGIDPITLSLPKTVTPQEVKNRIAVLNLDPEIDGILIQRPLPLGFHESEILYWVTPEKDVDAFHPVNAGRLFLGLPSFQPCTPAGIMALLDHYNLKVEGKIACVIGRSAIVGKPMSILLLKRNATVFQCHSKTPNLSTISRQADILVVAAGKLGLIDRSFVKEGAVVVDVGMHRNSEGKVVGDVVYDQVKNLASAITPVPGGVGPMTIALLMQNTITAAELREARD